MTKDEIMNLENIEDLEKRAADIVIETADADKEQLETLNAELDAIAERRAILKEEIEERKAAAEAVANGAGKEIETRKEDKKMTNLEIRKSHEYADAYLKYLKTGKDAECRALLSENANVDYGQPSVPVPEIVDGRIRASWEDDKIFSRVRKTFIRGNVKVGFELMTEAAQVHEEGSGSINEENLTLGIVTMIPKMIKKYITVSDEALGLSSEELLAYLYDEIGYQIVKRAADLVISAITSAPNDSQPNAVGVEQINGAVNAENIIKAMAKLGDNARDLVFIASGQTIADVKVAALQAQYAYDPFQGMTVIQKEGVTGAIIGDLAGVQANLPEGEAVRFKFDDLSLAEQDMVKIVGRLYAAIAVTGPGMFVTIDGESGSAS